MSQISGKCRNNVQIVATCLFLTIGTAPVALAEVKTEAVETLPLGQPPTAPLEHPKATPLGQAASLGQNATALHRALSAMPDAGGEIAAHYAGTAYTSLWFTADSDAAAKALLTALEDAPAHGLVASRYDTPRLRAALEQRKTGGAEAHAAAEIALTRAFLTYARDVSAGMLKPSAVDDELHLKPEAPGKTALLSGMSRAASAADYIAALAPPSDDYARLQGLLKDLRALAPDAWGGPAAIRRTLRIGERGPEIAALRARLVALGDHTPTGTAPALSDSMALANDAAPLADHAQIQSNDDALYDEPLEDSVRAFQRRHGLNADGVVGPKSIAALNTSITKRIGQVLVSLERQRWMPRDLGNRHVYVNQADFTVQLKESGKTLFSERVVVGKASDHRTPEFSDRMSYLVFNPVWHVPRSIATKEILPKLKADPSYLDKRNMRLVGRGGKTENPNFKDWSLYTASTFPYLIKQRPGGSNSLGRVKFMFPNDFAIYLHDTPSKSLFRKDSRAFSHGCVRVQDPMALARALLAPQRANPGAYIDRILGTPKERRVNLEEPVPVHLTYRTAWVDENGTPQFRDDIYGRDARILEALSAIGVSAQPES